MVFSSPSFLFLFLPLVLLLHASCPRSLRNAVLLAASLLFYTWGAGPAVLALVASACVNFALGLAAARAGSDRERSRVVFVAVLINVGLLAYFKYANFLVGEWNALAGTVGAPTVEWRAVALPIGISFFTFQALGYVLDIARRAEQPEGSLTRFTLFLAMFPQLIAGPIVRHRDVAEDLRARSLRRDAVVQGAARFAHGLVKKVLIADAAGAVVVVVFATPPEQLGPAAVATGLLAFYSFLYFDFSAYSDMAIGIGKVLGFRFPENFARPYSSASITEFWGRWHMTLSSWFRDYLFTPLGGWRGGALRTAFNTLVTMTLVGLWHGASWTFVVAGLYFGVVLVLERMTGYRKLRRFDVLRRVLTQFALLPAGLLFVSDDLGHATRVVSACLSPVSGFTADLHLALSTHAWFAIGMGPLTACLPRRFLAGREVMEGTGPAAAVLRWALVPLFLYAGLEVVTSSHNPFFYFQF